jgi:hypothetical protein
LEKVVGPQHITLTRAQRHAFADRVKETDSEDTDRRISADDRSR